MLDLGLIGCGGRGSWIVNLFADSGKYRLVACSDYFQDKVDAVGEKHGIDRSRRYTGLSGYKRLLEGKLDAVVIETPPYFHPQQSADAVDAGKHVYLAKPIAVDAPGCQQIAAAGTHATAKKQVFLVDFQTRANNLYQEAAQKVQAGEIGKIISAGASYHCGPTWDHMDRGGGMHRCGVEGSDHVFAFLRESPSDTLLVVVNFAPASARVSVRAAGLARAPRELTDNITRTSVRPSGDRLDLALERHGVRVFPFRP